MLRVERVATHLRSNHPAQPPAVATAATAAAVDDQLLAAHPAWLELDMGALRHNVALMRELIGPRQQLIASTKANAYGHGAAPIAAALEAAGVDGLWTGSFAEAAAARAAGVSIPILMFGAAAAAIPSMLGLDLTPTVFDDSTAAAATAAAAAMAPRGAEVIVKVDAGFGRLGVPLGEAAEFIIALHSQPNLSVVGVYTHLPFNSISGQGWAAGRQAKFEALLDDLKSRFGFEPPITQVSASAAVLAGATSQRCTAVCAGHALYGLRVADPPARILGGQVLRPVLRAIKARLIHVFDYPPLAGDGDDDDAQGLLGGYGVIRDPGGGRVGVLPWGLGDGARPAIAGAHDYVTVMMVEDEEAADSEEEEEEEEEESGAGHQQRQRVISRHHARILAVSLEYTTVDLSGVEGASAGDEVTLVGGVGADVETWASWHGCSALEMLCSVGGRLPVVALEV